MCCTGCAEHAVLRLCNRAVLDGYAKGCVSGHVILNFYFDQFYFCFTDNYLLFYRHWLNDFMILTISRLMS